MKNFDLVFTLSSLLVFVSLFNCTGTRPDDLGIRENGELKPCPPSPNCVSSFCDSSDEEHYIKALDLKKSIPDSIADLKSVLAKHENAVIIKETDNYIYAEFKSKLMGFVDDVEFYLDAKSNKLHYRSASRLGRSDLGVNRKRINQIILELGWN
ncbi:MAG: DUF1499 domain-containing protein [Leptospira sp.]|jgi:uncharacterized protein (DUF1499 family)|nr:DUF1499 domain-containing protein [Leptospira sp.]NCS95332.1 DUF1499 domain-containing protein [Leptospira sp.]